MDSTKAFITNEERLLDKVVNNILPSTENFDVLVGFFYFSGFIRIYKNIGNKNLRILVGLDIQKDLMNRVIEFEYLSERNTSRKLVRDSYNQQLVELFNETEYFDSEEDQEAFRIFLSKIKDGSLQIKKTLKPNHAKLYIFEKPFSHSENGEYPGVVITGSSNLTRNGFSGQNEINVELRTKAAFQEAKELFEKLWDDAIDIVNKENFDIFNTEVLEKIWLDKLPKPYLVYLRVLLEYFGTRESKGIKMPSEITKNKFMDLKYQSDAISQAIDIINRHNGVIIADVVGLGKSIIASTIAYNLGLKAIVIAPPHLVPQWEDYKYEFNFNAQVFSRGKIEEALERYNQNEEQLIIIDEAHKYRNENTTDYSMLQELCANNKVMLLSATPFNNKPEDIFSLIKLFQIPTKPTIQTVENLSWQFGAYIKEYKSIKKAQKEETKKAAEIELEIQSLANQIRNTLNPLFIRRSRIDLQEIDIYREDLQKQKITFPEVQAPEIMEYDLGDLSPLYSDTLELIKPENDSDSGLIGARYKPATYIKNIGKYKERISKDLNIETNLLTQGQSNLADFMRRLLVHRFESSVVAFETTLSNIINSNELIKGWYEKLGKIPIYKKGNLPDAESLLQQIDNTDDDLIEEYTFEKELQKYYNRGLLLIDKNELKNAFIKDINKDLELLYNIKERWEKERNGSDPKIEGFKKVLTEKLKDNPKRKIIVFSAYAATVDYLHEQLKDSFKVMKYTASASNKDLKKELVRNFDAGVPKEKQKNDYDILIATDAISEGYNLHRADIIFNYDIPYNPTVVIQRVGRINRINKKMFDKLYIYNFFPTATGEKETRTKGISTLKISMIQTLLGEDTQYLTNDEELRSYFVEEFKKRAGEEDDKRSWDVQYINLLNTLEREQDEALEKAKEIAKRTRIRRTKPKAQKGVLIFGKKGKDHVFKLSDGTNKPIALTTEDAIKLFKADIMEQAEKVSPTFDKIYQELKKTLFKRRTEFKRDKGKQVAIEKIKMMKTKCPWNKDYLEDLKRVAQEYDVLSAWAMKKIRDIDFNNIDQEMAELQNTIKHSFLASKIRQANEIDEGEETVILTEELI